VRVCSSVVPRKHRSSRGGKFEHRSRVPASSAICRRRSFDARDLQFEAVQRLDPPLGGALNLAGNMQATEIASMTPCQHFDQIRDVAPSARGCEDCLRVGGTWNELRVCLTCGHVGCCDDSKHRHATEHFQQTGHPLIQSFDAGEHWGWCYADKLYFDRMPALKRRGPWSFLERWFRR